MDNRKWNNSIYLNQKKVVFDMIASIADEFSHLSTIQTSHERNSLASGETFVEIDSSNMFALLSAKLKGALKGENVAKDSEIYLRERIHTPYSLFHKLRNYLDELQLVSTTGSMGSFSGLRAGEFIEIERASYSFIDGLAYANDETCVCFFRFKVSSR